MTSQHRSGSLHPLLDLKRLADAPVNLPPVLKVQDASTAISFYCAAFGARTLRRSTDASGRVDHGEIRLGSVVLTIDARAAVPPGPAGLPLPQGSCIEFPVEQIEARAACAMRYGAVLVKRTVDDDKRVRSVLLGDRFGLRWLLIERA